MKPYFNREDSEQRGWNMAIAYLMQLDRRRDEVSIAYSEGDLLKTYRLYWVIYRDIHFKANEIKEKQKIEQLFKDVRSFIYKEEMHHNEKVTAEEKLQELGILLNDALYALKLIFGKEIEKKSIEEQLLDDYNDS